MLLITRRSILTSEPWIMMIPTLGLLERDCFCRTTALKHEEQSSKVLGGISVCGVDWVLMLMLTMMKIGLQWTSGSYRFGTGNTRRRPIGTVSSHYDVGVEFCSLGNTRLLVITDNLKLYSIEDMSQAPDLLACFLMPVSLMLRCFPGLPVDDIGHSSQPQIQAQRMMYTSDPAHRLLCLTAFSSHTDGTQVFIISTRIFFNLDGMAASGLFQCSYFLAPI
ncbi:uncharacterized protein BJ212DRAFT_898030 [Suillus subaureus]|uniref:Uncharacterized protein n=1 Tax=Suillus subaureus TaxID=48587 RepID=A0A9P7J5W6_9AGAM|nr:uncharacterized protein BJ212DRAFT_898030 [Suillus subaureus]KAG1804419.1 hypothetical protein BJ212DRAFT_898030 [Suillus subaureus]